jgi:hypothetical protein
LNGGRKKKQTSQQVSLGRWFHFDSFQLKCKSNRRLICIGRQSAFSSMSCWEQHSAGQSASPSLPRWPSALLAGIDGIIKSQRRFHWKHLLSWANFFFFFIRWQVLGTGTTNVFLFGYYWAPPCPPSQWTEMDFVSQRRKAMVTGCDHGDRSDPSRFSLTTEEWQRETSGNARPPIVNIVISSDLHSQLSMRAGGWVNERASHWIKRPRTEMK